MIRDDRGDRLNVVVDVAGLALGVEAGDADRAALGRRILSGFPPSAAAPAVTLRIDARAVPAPTEPPREEMFGVRFWQRGGRATVASGRAVASVEGSGVVAHVPDLSDAMVVEAMVPAVLAWALGRHGRFVVHGGAVAWADRAFLVLGHSGAGKSTLVAAALEHGWRALADDLVVLAAEGDVVRVFGVHRRPAVPLEIGGPIVSMGEVLRDPRARTELASDVLSGDGADVAGTIVVGHAQDAAGALQPIGHRHVVPLLLQSFPATVDPELRARLFAFSERLVALPAWELGHAADVGLRRAHAGAALTRCRDTALDAPRR